jgi:hypothetical protein
VSRDLSAIRIYRLGKTHRRTSGVGFTTASQRVLEWPQISLNDDPFCRIYEQITR